MTTEAITAQTPPILHGPSEKEKKYDRQLRLWAAAGQQALEDAHILLLNSGSGTVGVETLKNLVLPGIGKFTISDDAVVSEADLGVNFFLDEESLGRSRAESCVRLLQELNPDVEGDWHPKNQGETITNLLEANKFTLVIYTLPIPEETLRHLQQYASTHSVPLVSLHSAGFYSYFQIHLPGTFPIVDTHPETTATTDLRLLSPWPELAGFAADLTSNLADLSDHKHGHIPYLALILHYLAVWKEENNSLPTTYKEKAAFKQFLARGARTNNAEGGEENYEEAVAAVVKTVVRPELSSAVREVFDHKATEIELQSSFWIIAEAIKKFYAEHKELPLPGSVPDMKAESEIYVRLQNIYKAKARKDAAEVLETVRSHPNGTNVDSEEVDAFCKNAAFVKLIRASDSVSNLERLATNEASDEQSLFPIYLALSATSHVAKASSSEILANIEKISSDAATSSRIAEAATEVARAKGGELHNISSLTGGMVAQEVIKIITKQYIPIDNLCVFDGIASKTQTDGYQKFHMNAGRRYLRDWAPQQIVDPP